MRSEMMEFLRFGDPTGILRKGDPYLAVSGRNPVRELLREVRGDHLGFAQVSGSIGTGGQRELRV